MTIDIVFLSAGMGTRLKPITNNVPKALVKVKGKPILYNSVELFRRSGLKKIYCVTGYKANKINNKKIKHIYNKDFESTNMVHSLYLALNKLKNNKNDIIISYSDIIYSSEVLMKLVNSNYSISVITDDNWYKYWRKRFVNPYQDAETCKINHNNNITELGNRAKSSKNIDSQYIGLIKLNNTQKRKIYQILKKEKLSFDKNRLDTKIKKGYQYNNIYLTDLINFLIKKKTIVKAIRINGGWLEIDSKKDLKIAENLSKVKNGILEIKR